MKIFLSLVLMVFCAFGLIYLVEGYWESRPGYADSMMPNVVAQEKVADSAVGRDGGRAGYLKSGIFGWLAQSPRQEKPVEAKPKNPEVRQDEVHHGLCVAAMTGDLKKTRRLLEAGINPNARDAFGIRALARATIWGHADVVELLLDFGAEVHEREMFGVTVLMLAVNQGDKGLVETFLVKGAEVNDQSDDGKTALSIAIQKGYEPIADLLKSYGAVQEEPGQIAKTSEGKDSGAQKTKASLTEEKFAAGRPLPGLEAMTWAEDISRNSVASIEAEVAEYLSEEQEEKETVTQSSAGTKKDLAREDESLEPLPDEFEEIRQKILRVLEISKSSKKFYAEYSLKVEPEKPVQPRQSKKAVSLKPQEDAAADAKVELSAPSHESMTPEQKRGSFKKSRQVLADKIFALKRKRVPKPLKKTVDSPDAGHKTPRAALTRSKTFPPDALIQAALAGDVTRASLLIEHGVDVNSRGDLEMTALMIAAQDGHRDLVGLLLRKGADRHAENLFGQTALNLAELREHVAVVSILKEQGTP